MKTSQRVGRLAIQDILCLLREGTESSLGYFKVSYNFEIWVINTDSKSWSALSFVYFMTFYKHQNFLKSPPRMQEMACQGLYISKFSWGPCPQTPYRFLAPLVLGPQAKTTLYAYLHADWLEYMSSCWEYMKVDEITWELMRVHENWWKYMFLAKALFFFIIDLYQLRFPYLSNVSKIVFIICFIIWQ